MAEYVVTRKADGAEVYRYNADAPIEWSGMEFTTHDHIEDIQSVISPTAPTDPSRWRIHVGSLFDRFDTAKLAILSDPDPVVQAIIKDASVRKYIDLLGRRDELLQVIGLLNSKGHAVSASVVLDVEPNEDEVWRAVEILSEPVVATPPAPPSQFIPTHTVQDLGPAMVETDGTVRLADGRWSTLNALAAMDKTVEAI